MERVVDLFLAGKLPGLNHARRTLGAAASVPALDLAQGAELQRLDRLAQYCVLSR